MNLLATVLGYALTSVFALEESIPASGFGSTKKEIAMGGIQALLNAATLETTSLAHLGSNVGTNLTIAQMTSAVSTFIDATVAALNKGKVFATVKAA